MGKNPEKKRKNKREATENDKNDKDEMKNAPSVEKDEKLMIKIITNKEPIIEKIPPKKEESNKANKCKPSKFFKFFLSSKGKSKENQVNIPHCDWKGNINCRIFKKVDFRSNAKCHSQRGMFFLSNQICLLIFY